MKDQIQFEENVQFVIARRFLTITEAKIYETILLNAGIKAFLSNVNTSQMLPFTDGGISLHVASHQKTEAFELIKELDNEAVKPFDEDYREADHDDIEFAKQVKTREELLQRSRPAALAAGIILIVIFILIIAITIGFQYF